MNEIDEAQVNEFAGRFLGDLAAAMHSATVVIGEELGLYRALAEVGPATAAQVAATAGCDERYVLEWLNAQAASGYCEYADGTYRLNAVQAFCLADPASLAYLTAGMLLVTAVHRDIDRSVDAVRTGRGVAWGDHDHRLFAGVERFFRPGYQANLTTSWIPALEGVEDKLRQGATVADVGCGHGASSIVLAQAFPAARVVGFDAHPGSIDAARKAAVEAGVGDRVSFEVATAQNFPGTYDLIGVFDALHDMGDPVGAAAHIHAALAPGGTWLLVEPAAQESVADNIASFTGRLFYSGSTLLCTQAARSQTGGYALGAQASTEQLRAVCEQGGFTRFRLAAATPVNRVFEVRP
ncbi:MAG TPA: class I SAM-dependent methyltransferase [Micromonosporaceae bacterium]|nr:class I SAM-dependent methyltransferase [Micromonosporaceae bacterium]